MKKRGIATRVLAASVIVLILLVAGGLFILRRPNGTASSSGKSFEFAVIAKGNIEKTVSSSGTLEPVSTVSVLAEMSGRAEKVYADFNDKVEKGQVLVELNTDMLKLNREEQVASLRKAQANYDLQLLDYTNKKKLAQKGLSSDYDLQSSATNLEIYGAELESAKAALKVIDTQISQYALIKSPIDGIVLERDVDAGQSVVEGSSSNSSSLFTLAENLKNMQIKATVDELDIASIHQGQQVRFTVEALPNIERTGTVAQVRLVPETSDNVVSYYVIVDAENEDGQLLPGMTAEVEFIEESVEDAILVPNGAFRFQPPGLSTEEIAKKTFEASLSKLSPEQKQEALKRFQETQKAGEKKSDSSQSGGITGLLGGGGPGGMPGGGGPGGPPPGGFGGGPGGGPGSRQSTKSSSSKSADAAQQNLGESPTGTPGDVGAAPQAAGATAGTAKTLWYLDQSGQYQALLVRAGVSDGSKTQLLDADELEGFQVILKEKVR